MKEAILIISLDFELHWGLFHHWDFHAATGQFTTKPNGKDTWHNNKFNQQYFLNTRQVIPEVLKLFTDYNIHATWATVGFLMANGKDDLSKLSPVIKPDYSDQRYSSYEFIEQVGVGLNEESDPFHFAPSLVRLIQSTSGQEIGSHTWSHFLINEHGQSLDQFRLDLRSAKAAAEKTSSELKSLVLPGNQMNEAYLKVCKAEGFEIVRTNPSKWFWNIDTKKEAFTKRLFRILDDYLPILPSISNDLKRLNSKKDLPFLLPANRFFRPYSPALGVLNELRLHRIFADLKRAAHQKRIYHLWWHPHNFGFFPNENLRDLKRILERFSEIREQNGFSSLNMRETAVQLHDIQS